MDGGYTWLGVVIVIGSMISLGYYLRVVAAMWMRPGDLRTSVPSGMPAIAGAAPEADPIDPEAGRRAYLVGPALLAAAATVFFGVIPQPLVEFAEHAGASLCFNRSPYVTRTFEAILLVAGFASGGKHIG